MLCKCIKKYNINYLQGKIAKVSTELSQKTLTKRMQDLSDTAALGQVTIAQGGKSVSPEDTSSESLAPV